MEPGIFPIPPSTTNTSTLIDSLKLNLVGSSVAMLSPYRAPAMPASAAAVTKAIILYLVMLMPMDSAAIRLSRAAMIARPERELTRFSTTIREKITRINPAVKVAMVLTFTAPMGPFSSRVPGRFPSRKPQFSPWPSTDT